MIYKKNNPPKWLRQEANWPDDTYYLRVLENDGQTVCTIYARSDFSNIDEIVLLAMANIDPLTINLVSEMIGLANQALSTVDAC